MATADFLQREKLSHPNPTPSAEQQDATTHLMNEIHARLAAEERDYQQFREGWPMKLRLHPGSRKWSSW